MPVFPLPLVGNPNRRGFNVTDITTQDQIYRGVIFQAVPNPLTKSADIYVQKRLGLYREQTPAAGKVGQALYQSPSLGSAGMIQAFGTTAGGTSTVYDGNISLGAVTANHVVYHINETVLSSGTTN